MSVRYKIRDQHGLYFMTCTICGWVDLFTRKIYRDLVIDSWRYCQKNKGLQIHAYVFMSNHLHLIASCKKPDRLESVMRDWKRHCAKSFKNYLNDQEKVESRRSWLLHLFRYFAKDRRHVQENQFWEHDNHPIVLYSPEVIEQKLFYIHRNPVVAGWVAQADHWLYSSAPDYAGTRTTPLLDIIPVWQWFYEEGLGFNSMPDVFTYT